MSAPEPAEKTKPERKTFPYERYRTAGIISLVLGPVSFVYLSYRRYFQPEAGKTDPETERLS
jgi:hypothetical protein